MQRRSVVPWLVLISTLLLSGCVRTFYQDPTPLPQIAESPTPIVVFNPTATPSPLPSPQFPPSIYFEPSVVDLPAGQITTVNIWVEEARQLARITLEIGFNPSQLQIEDADPALDGIQIATGEMLGTPEVTRNEVIVSDSGMVYYEASQPEGEAVDGTGIVASVTLRGLGGGLTPLRIENVSAYDAQGNEFEVTPLSTGLVNVVGDAVPTTAPDAQPTESPTAAAATQPTQSDPTAAPTSVATAVPTNTPAQLPVSSGGIYYVVQAGENIYRIGLRFGTTTEAIAAASNIADPDQVQAGTLILIPVSPPQGNHGYYVQRRDTVYSIARRFGMTVEQLVSLNGLGSDYHIEPEQILAVTP